MVGKNDPTIGAAAAWLIVFDRREKSKALPWEQRLSRKTYDATHGQVNVVIC